MNYIDTHSHLPFKDFDEDRDAIISEMKEKGTITITIGTDYEESKKAVALAEKHDNIYASVGLHPADNADEVFDYDKYLELTKHPKVVAIGECGVDYFHKGKNKEEQINIFKEHIKLAVEVDKPLMLHVRPKENNDAYLDAIEILKEKKEKYGDKLRGNFHFFVGDKHIAQEILDLETFTMSFPGVITFAKEYEEVVKFVPLDMMHAETDSPYVSPVPNRGKRNSPLNVKYIIEKIAEIKNLPVEEVKEQLRKNFKRDFSIKA
jgi:TatD DNase family protein